MEAKYFTIMYWFCHTSTWICHGGTRVPNPEPPSQLSPHTIPLGHRSAPATSILHPSSNLDWWFISYMVLYMFQCHSPKFLRGHWVKKREVITKAYGWFPQKRGRRLGHVHTQNEDHWRRRWLSTSKRKSPWKKSIQLTPQSQTSSL